MTEQAKDFTALDSAIMTRIAESACTFTSIKAAVEHIAEPFANKRREIFRVVDRRLQALRKRGLIHFGNKKWFMSEPVKTP